jgi:hypothetical protein
MRIIFAAGIALSLAFASAVWAAEPVAIPPQIIQPPSTEEPTSDTVPLTPDKYDRMTVDVMIGERGPYPFVVDTASQATVISRELATRLALREGDQRRLHGMGATRMVDTVVIPDLIVGELKMRRITAPALSQTNMGSQGILGINALASRNMVMDFTTGVMTLTPSRKKEEDDWEGETITVTARSRLGQLILTNAKIEEDRVVVIIDTGSDTSIGNMALRKRLLQRRGEGGVDSIKPVQMIDVTGSVTHLDYTIVDNLRIATLDFSNLPVAFGDAHMFRVLDLSRTPALLLGMDALRLFGRVTIDFGDKEVRFDRLPPGGKVSLRRPSATNSEPASDEVPPVPAGGAPN